MYVENSKRLTLAGARKMMQTAMGMAEEARIPIAVAIADVLGHRWVHNTFIYAKADLEALRQVALPWPEVQR